MSKYRELALELVALLTGIAIFIVSVAFLAKFFGTPGISLTTHKEPLMAVVTVVYGGAGLLLGVVFFYHKLLKEEKSSNDGRRRHRLLKIYDQLISIDSLVSQIILSRPAEYPLVEISSIVGCVSITTEFIDNNDKLLGFTDSELDYLLELDRFVDKSTLLCGKDDYDCGNLVEECESLIPILKKARSVCLLKSEFL